MPYIFGLSIVLQIGCMIHAVRTGRPHWWIWLLIIGSYPVVIVYSLTQILPDLHASPAARKAVRNVQRAIDPEREKKRIAAQLEVADTVQNRLRLAEECLNLGDVLNAEELYASCLKGPHATDPDIMLGLARAQFGRGDATATQKTLDELIAANPEFKSQDGHLLYARSLEALGEHDRALQEYSVLSESYPGEEARARYGLLLKRQGMLVEAQQMFQKVLARTKVAPRYYQKTQREWIELAREQLKA
jgi:hypothetical protein